MYEILRNGERHIWVEGVSLKASQAAVFLGSWWWSVYAAWCVLSGLVRTGVSTSDPSPHILIVTSSPSSAFPLIPLTFSRCLLDFPCSIYLSFTFSPVLSLLLCLTLTLSLLSSHSGSIPFACLISQMACEAGELRHLCCVSACRLLGSAWTAGLATSPPCWPLTFLSLACFLSLSFSPITL